MIYEELAGPDFEMIAVALDTAGTAAVEAKVRPPDLDERPDTLHRLRGWSEDAWRRKAFPAFPCVVDEEHLVADLYGIVNVPSAVWIDEDGRIVRPPEPAGVSDHFRRMDPETFAIPDDDAARAEENRRRYVDALRDWLRRGDESPYALSAEAVRARRRLPSEDEVRAAVHVRLGHHLYEQGAVEAAKHHVGEAARLCPDKMIYVRQARVLDPELVGGLDVSEAYYEGIEALGARLYYPPVELPGFSNDPPWLDDS